MGLLNFSFNSGDYSKEYLNTIKNDAFIRIDSKKNGANTDGKISVNEAYNDLNIGGLLSGLKQGSAEYNKLNGLTANLPKTLAQYAGTDGVFSANEWADFINGDEWNKVIDVYHSSSNFAKIEMGWIDNSKNTYKDGEVTKGEVKVGILNNLAINNPNVDASKIEALIDKYAGDDGTFTVSEYMKLKQNPEYKAFLQKHDITPFE